MPFSVAASRYFKTERVAIHPFEKRPQDFEVIVFQRIVNREAFSPELDDVTVLQLSQMLGDSRNAQFQDVAQVTRAKLFLSVQQIKDFQAHFIAGEFQHPAEQRKSVKAGFQGFSTGLNLGMVSKGSDATNWFHKKTLSTKLVYFII